MDFDTGFTQSYSKDKGKEKHFVILKAIYIKEKHSYKDINAQWSHQKIQTLIYEIIILHFTRIY